MRSRLNRRARGVGLSGQRGPIRRPDLEAEFKQLGGYFELDSVNRSLLGGLLPTLVHIQASDPAAGRLKRTIDSIVEEALADRPGRDLVVDRLIEVLLVEALRFGSEGVDAIGKPGLLVGLADPLLARALRRLHSDVAHAWSVEELARAAGLSRSVFSERFSQKVGVPPMQYVMDWRMALAKAMLRRDTPPLEAVAAAIGYQSASAFSTAFRREVGSPPSHFRSHHNRLTVSQPQGAASGVQAQRRHHYMRDGALGSAKRRSCKSPPTMCGKQ